MDKGGEEIIDKSGNLIEANTKIIVRRLPMKELDPIELSYNQMNNKLTKKKELRRLGLDKVGIENLSDEKSEQADEDEEAASEVEDIEEDLHDKIESYSIDLKYLDLEFICPRDKHIISNPVITSCCGVTLCLKCAVDAIYKT